MIKLPTFYFAAATVAAVIGFSGITDTGDSLARFVCCVMAVLFIDSVISGLAVRRRAPI